MENNLVPKIKNRKSPSPKFELTFFEKEHRLDSRLYSQRMDVTPKATNQLIKHHQNRLEKFGLLPFEMEAVKRKRGVKYEKYFLLNESQSIFLLTLSRNTEKVMDLKEDLTREFMFYRKQTLKKARKAEMRGQIEWQQTRFEGKEDRRELTDAIKPLVALADESGSKNADKYYETFSKLIYDQLFGIKKAPLNFRDTLDKESLKQLKMVEWKVSQWLNQAIETCTDYHQPYQIIKGKLKALVSVIGTLNPCREIAA